MANEKRKCKACGLQFYTTDPTKELCHCCDEALKRLNGYAVPVVRCKDCEYRHDSCFAGKGNIYCDYHHKYFGLDDFCSYGERKDNE